MAAVAAGAVIAVGDPAAGEAGALFAVAAVLGVGDWGAGASGLGAVAACIEGAFAGGETAIGCAAGATGIVEAVDESGVGSVCPEAVSVGGVTDG